MKRFIKITTILYLKALCLNFKELQKKQKITSFRNDCTVIYLWR